MFKLLSAVAIAAFAFFLGTPERALAYDLRPIIIQLAPTGAGSSGTVLITNSHEEPIAIEARAYLRIQNPDGTEERIPEDEDIIITPPQMVIAPGSSQAVRVRWVGDPNPDRELTFRLVTEQLPIRLATESGAETTANLSFAYRYEAALYIVPPESRPAARITRAEPVLDETGTQWLELDIASEGTRRAILEGPALSISTSGSSSPLLLEGEAVQPLVGLNILSGGYRTVRVAWPEGLAVGPVEAELQTSYTVFQ